MAVPDSFSETVHVRLLDEGVDVWRPVRARRLAAGAYELAHEPAPDDEIWEFGPGECVCVEDRALSEGAARVAVARAKS